MQPMAPQGGMPQQPQPGMMQMPPQNDAEKFEQDAARLLPSVMERNPYLKEQVGLSMTSSKRLSVLRKPQKLL